MMIDRIHLLFSFISRRYIMKRILSAALVLTLLCSCLLCGCSLFQASPKTFTKSGMSITLTDDFTERDYVSYTAVYDSQYVAIFAIKEEFSLFDGTALGENSTTEDYANVVIEGYELDAEPEEIDGMTTFRYDAESNGDTYTYLAVIYKSDDAFWMIQFATKADNFEEQEDNILTYAKSVAFE